MNDNKTAALNRFNFQFKDQPLYERVSIPSTSFNTFTRFPFNPIATLAFTDDATLMQFLLSILRDKLSPPLSPLRTLAPSVTCQVQDQVYARETERDRQAARRKGVAIA